MNPLNKPLTIVAKNGDHFYDSEVSSHFTYFIFIHWIIALVLTLLPIFTISCPEILKGILFSNELKENEFKDSFEKSLSKIEEFENEKP